MQETDFLIYRYDEGELEFVRRLFIKHATGTVVTNEMVREQMERELYDFKPALYRAVPTDRMVDLEVKGTVVLS